MLPLLREMYHDSPYLIETQPAGPVIGSWMVNGYACGIGIREQDRFVPHIFTD